MHSNLNHPTQHCSLTPPLVPSLIHPYCKPTAHLVSFPSHYIPMMFHLCFLLTGFALADYSRYSIDDVYFSMNGFADRFYPWVGPGYHNSGSDWGGTCATSRSQSPIDIVDAPHDPSHFQVVTAGNSTFNPILFKNYPAPLRIQPTGMVDMYWLYAGTLTQVTSSITLNQVLSFIMFQTPAEHPVNGHRYPLSVQLGYAGAMANGAITFGYQVVVNIQEGAANPALDQFINQQPFDASWLLPPNGVLDDYYFYLGSFNAPIPDCVEGFAWVISNYVVEASRDQIAYFEDLYINDRSFSGGAGNVRAVQPLNDRTLYHVIPGGQGEQPLHPREPVGNACPPPIVV